MKTNILAGFFFIAVLSLSNQSFSQIDIGYQLPPEEILELAGAKPTPSVWFSDDGEYMILFERSNYITLEELASEEFRLAGLRIDPATNGPSRTRYFYGITVQKIPGGEEKKVALPEKAKIGNLEWSPDQSMIAFTLTGAEGISLWILDVATAEARALTRPVLNDVFSGSPYAWEGSNVSLLCRIVEDERGETPEARKLPEGPVVQENTGDKAPARTYQDLLKNKTDEALFEYFATSRLVRVTIDGEMTGLHPPCLMTSMSPSPDGRYILIETLSKPYSYQVPYYRFGYTVQVLDYLGNIIKDVAEVGLAEVMPKGFMAVMKGPRNFSWRNDRPSEIYWVEALDEGDPEVEAAYRDAVYTAGFPFDTGIREHLLSTVNRFRGITWGPGDLAIAYDYWWSDRNRKIYLLRKNNDPEIIFDLNTEDLYGDPGRFLTEDNEYGRRVLTVRDGKWLYLEGQGYGPEGNRPFLDLYHLKKQETTRIWQAEGEDTYENIVKVLDPGKGEIITSVESVTEFPQFFFRNVVTRSEPVQITRFPHPYESIRGITREFIRYRRDDGVDLTATLYLPENYDPAAAGPLPTILWAYPREYKDPKAAGQMKTSPYRFTYLYYGSPIYWVTRGYAIIDRADFPIIGEGEEEPNDNFIGQLIANARAAIDHCAELGVTDTARVAVGGHSYGAFMTANLLTHSDLFAAGIARSGAYNRTLTPFGFQSEERTYWEAPDVYRQMSPFMHADKMKTPLLLIHGESDNNSGTFPMQSERYYDALKGHGATVRLVLLPYESHGYSARENVMHMLWEQDTWLERWLKESE